MNNFLFALVFFQEWFLTESNNPSMKILFPSRKKYGKNRKKTFKMTLEYIEMLL